MAVMKKTTSVKKTEAVKAPAKETVKAPVAETKAVVKEEVKAPVKEAPVKETADKAEKKAPAKKAPAKKAPAKKVALKTTTTVQFAGKSYSEEDLVTIAKNVWKYDLKKKVGDIKTIDLYVKPEENAVYYVINGTEKGSFAI